MNFETHVSGLSIEFEPCLPNCPTEKTQFVLSEGNDHCVDMDRVTMWISNADRHKLTSVLYLMNLSVFLF